MGETIKSLNFRAHQKELELVFHIDPEVPDAVIGDPGRIRQILVNLIGNAIKFTEHGETLVTIGEEHRAADHSLLRVEVQDTGLGIPADQQRKYSKRSRKRIAPWPENMEARDWGSRFVRVWWK